MLARQNVALAIYISRRYATMNPFMEKALESAVLWGICRAFVKRDTERKLTFKHFATIQIVGALLDALQTKGQVVGRLRNRPGKQPTPKRTESQLSPVAVGTPSTPTLDAMLDSEPGQLDVQADELACLRAAIVGPGRVRPSQASPEPSRTKHGPLAGRIKACATLA